MVSRSYGIVYAADTVSHGEDRGPAMSQGTSRLVQLGGGAMVLVFLPIMIVIALIFASLSAVEEAQACSPATSTEPTFAWPVASHQPSISFETSLHQHVVFPAADEDVHSIGPGRVVSAGGASVTVEGDDRQTPRPTNGSGTMRVTYSGLSVTVHEGDRLTMGQTLGHASGTLTLRIELDGEVVDPMDFLQEQQAPTGGCSCGGSGQLIGSDNQQKVFNYFVGRGYTKEQAAGILGNMIHESGVEPMKLQGGATVSSAVAVGNPNGWGIVQWTPASKMINPSRDAGKSFEQIDTLEWQVDFLYNQLTGNSPVPEVGPGDALKRAHTVEEATVAFAGFERFLGWENPDNPEYLERMGAAREVLQLYGGGAQGGPGTGCGAGGDFVQTARNLAWPEPGHGPDKGDAESAYQQAMPQFNGTPDGADQPYSDCGVFVATVVRMTGADPQYPPRGTGVQLAYVRSHPEKYEVFQPTNTSQLQPGDIFIIADAFDGHTYIYTGDYQGSDGQTYNAVSASWHGHVPQASRAYFRGDKGGGPYTVARLKNRA